MCVCVCVCEWEREREREREREMGIGYIIYTAASETLRDWLSCKRQTDA